MSLPLQDTEDSYFLSHSLLFLPSQASFYFFSTFSFNMTMHDSVKNSINETCQETENISYFSRLSKWWSNYRSTLPSNMVLSKTLMIFLAYIAVGWSDSLLGANLTQFQLSLESSTQTTCYLLQASFAGFTTGNLVLSLLSHRMSLPMLQVTAITMLCVTTLFTPHLHDLNTLLYVFFTSGLASGFFAASAISRVLEMWGNESAPLLQLLDCMYGIGSILGPFISRFFLIEITTHVLNHGSSAHSSSYHNHQNETTNQILLFVHPHTNETLTPDDLLIVYPYSLLSTYSAICATILFILFIIQRKDEIHRSRLLSISTGKLQSARNSIATLAPADSIGDLNSVCDVCDDKSSDKSSLCLTLKTSIVILIASLTYALAIGTGMIEQSFITKFVTISNYNLTASQGATIESSSWVTNVAFGAGSIVLINKLGLEVTLIVCAAITALSQVFMLSMTHTGAEWVLWTSVNLVSLGVSPLFGTLVAYMETKFTVTPRAAAFYMILNCIGNVVWPLMVSSYIDEYPYIYIYSMSVTALTSSVLAILVIILCRLFFPTASPSPASSTNDLCKIAQNNNIPPA